MGALDEFKVLDALIREINTRKKKGIKDPRAQYTVLLNRVIKENNGVKESSARPQTSKYLKNLRKDGYVVREKIGRNAWYDVTAPGRLFHLTCRDRLDPSRRWLEEPLQGCYLSYAVIPPSSGLIHERLEANEFKGKAILEELVDQLKRLNPDLDSLFIRLDQEE